MNEAASPPGELQQAYEALRAQVTGVLTSVTPRGLALFLAQGLPSWLNAWAAPLRATGAVRRMPAGETLPSLSQTHDSGESPQIRPFDPELVRVLTEMALGAERRCVT